MTRAESHKLTLLFSDVEGSTRLAHALGDGTYHDLLNEHRRILREAFAAHGGVEVGTEGDSFFVVFENPGAALAAAVDAQRSLAGYPWPDGNAFRVRMGLHTGEVQRDVDGYVGYEVHVAARVAGCAHGGQIICSDATAFALGDRLSGGVSLRALGEHRLKDVAERVALSQVCHPSLEPTFPPPRSLTAVPNNIPFQATSFIGRHREMDEIARAVRSDCRLITLTGVGGAGKTRLAIEAAGSLAPELAGVWFVELASLTDPDLIADAVVRTARIDPDPKEPILDTLVRRIGSQDVLLVLDNAEHLIDGVAAFTETLLRRTERCRLIVTSREPLGVGGERILATTSLTSPVDGEPPLTSEAVRLFCERARAARDAFSLSGNERDVESICRRLDGIPLAIELAAARLRSLSVAQVAQRLDDRFRLLSGGSRTSIERHRTLRAAIDWSYDLLTDEERTLARVLAVFPAGITLADAEHLVAGIDVVAVISALVDKSWLVLDFDRDRYRMLETVRDYLLNRLEEAGELAEARSRLLSFAEKVAGEAIGLHLSANEDTTVARLRSEHDNIRAALDWAEAIEHPRFPALVAGFASYLVTQNYLEAFLAKLDVALPAVPADDDLIRGRLLFHRGVAHINRGQYGLACDHLDAALACATRAGEHDLVGRILHSLALAHRFRGDIDKAKRLLHRRIEIAPPDTDPALLSLSVGFVGDMAMLENDWDEAQRWYERGLAIVRGSALPPRLAMYYEESIARLALLRGDPLRAREVATPALETAQRIGDGEHLVLCLVELGLVALIDGGVQESLARYTAAAAAAKDLTRPFLHAEIAAFGAILAVAAGRLDTAAMMLGATAALREGTPGVVPFAAPDRLAEAETCARDGLSAAAFDDAFARGKADPLAAVRAGADLG